MVKGLIEAGASADITDNDGRTAAQEARKFGHGEILEFLTPRVCRAKQDI